MQSVGRSEADYCGKAGAIIPITQNRKAGFHRDGPISRYNVVVPFIIREFDPADFDTLWRIDQSCFPPGVSYSRAELRIYMRRRASFTLVAVDGGDGKSSDSHSGKGSRRTRTRTRTRTKKQAPSISSSDESLTNGAIAGFIVAEANSRDSGHIITIDVLAASRGTGVGSLLLGAAESRLGRAGCSSVQLETAVDNIAALSFYKKHGYSVIETSPRYYANGVDALVLKKELPGLG